MVDVAPRTVAEYGHDGRGKRPGPVAQQHVGAAFDQIIFRVIYLGGHAEVAPAVAVEVAHRDGRQARTDILTDVDVGGSSEGAVAVAQQYAHGTAEDLADGEVRP